MDLESWRPEDNARRFALMLAASAGSFAFIALWLAAMWPVLLALLAGGLAGVLVRVVTYPVLLAIFRR